MLDGVIKFQCEHQLAEWGSFSLLLNPDLQSQLEELDALRTELFDAGLVGVTKSGIGYGNISLRYKDTFIISSSGTGGARELGIDGYGLVELVDIEQNMLQCKGPLKASSESLTHAAIYQNSPDVNCVVHAHNILLFNMLLERKVPTTPKNVEYGTVAMAKSIMDCTHPLEGCIVMAGHEDGIIFYGASISQLHAYIAFIVDIYEQEYNAKPCHKHSQDILSQPVTQLKAHCSHTNKKCQNRNS